MVQAARGSSVLFRLTSTAGESAEAVVKLNSTETYAHRRFILANSKLHQANLTGTVEYEGQPEQTWPLTEAVPPHVRVLSRVRERLRVEGQRWYRITTVVYTQDGERTALESYELDPHVWPPPSPPSPPPPPSATPINATYTPFGTVQGFILRVYSCDPGSTLLFRLLGREGPPLEVTMETPGPPPPKGWYYLSPNFAGTTIIKGTVEYLGRPREVWRVAMHDA